MTPTPPPPPLPQMPPGGGSPPAIPGDTIMRGCAMGCASQLGWIALGGALAYVLPGKASDNAFAICIITQWLTLIPLVMLERSKGYRSSVAGLILIGCVALLLGGSCAALIWNPPSFH